MKVKISASVTVVDERLSNVIVREPARLAAIDSAHSDECFSDYLIDDRSIADFLHKGISGGYLSFHFHRNSNELRAETDYDIIEPLTESEIDALKNYTCGQWSDGIGENFASDYAEQTGLFLLPDTENAIVEIT